jgi:type II secretory pathway component PulF
MRLAPKIKDTVAWLLSGEQGSLMSGGFMPRGSRLRQTVEFQSVVSRLALITRLNLPLCSALEAAAKGESRRMGRMLQEMSRSIGTGVSVSAALEAACRGYPVQVAAILRRAEECGQLRQALAEQELMMAANIDAQSRSTAHTRHAVAYATIMVLFAVLMVSGIAIVVMPKFRDIFSDYDAPLPAITLMLIDAASWFGAYGWIVLVVALLIVSGVVFVCARARAGDETGIVARIVAALRWAMPITRTLDYGLGMEKAIRSMALGIRTGSPTAFADTLPSVVRVTNHLRRRLADFARGISGGVAPHQAAQDAKLGDVLVCALEMVERGEDPERVLGHAADYYGAIAYRWWHALAAVSDPLVTLAMAAMVGFIALALFLPLIALIDVVSEGL